MFAHELPTAPAELRAQVCVEREVQQAVPQARQIARAHEQARLIVETNFAGAIAIIRDDWARCGERLG